MSALFLRTVAVILMLLDHIGYCTGSVALRVVGRLSFPLFAFLLANGYRHTRSVPRYAIRLFLFALISEIPYDLCFNGGTVCYVSLGGLLLDLRLDNVYFTLLLGLSFLWLHDIYKRKLPNIAGLCSVVSLLLIAFFAAYVSADYGVLGVLWVALFGFATDLRNKRERQYLCLGAVLLSVWRLLFRSLDVYWGIAVSSPFLAPFFPSGALQRMDVLQCFAAFSVVLVLWYDQTSGMPSHPVWRRILQYSFYLFYPMHILILWLVF